MPKIKSKIVVHIADQSIDCRKRKSLSHQLKHWYTYTYIWYTHTCPKYFLCYLIARMLKIVRCFFYLSGLWVTGPNSGLLLTWTCVNYFLFGQSIHSKHLADLVNKNSNKINQEDEWSFFFFQEKKHLLQSRRTNNFLSAVSHLLFKLC